MEAGLSPGDFVFDGDPATPRNKGTPTPLIFGPCLLWPNGWMDEDLGPGHIVLDGVPALHGKGTAARLFGPMSIVATVAHLSYC